MQTQGKSQKKLKDLMTQFITVVVIAALALLLLNVLSQGKDGRRQVVDNDGGDEYIGASGGVSGTDQEKRLAEILSQIKGVGRVEVMIECRDGENGVSVFSSGRDEEKQKVKGVIIAAQGAADAVTKNDIIKAVASVFDIPQSRVMVFEMKQEQGGIER